MWLSSSVSLSALKLHSGHWYTISSIVFVECGIIFLVVWPVSARVKAKADDPLVQVVCASWVPAVLRRRVASMLLLDVLLVCFV
jgi:hypothetical protein